MTHPIDLYVGKRIRKRRKLVGLTLQKLAEMVGVNYQQIQKYETADSKISPRRLYELAAALSVHVGYFFEGMPQDAAGELTPPNNKGLAAMELLSRRETSELVLAYYSLQEHERQHLLEFLKLLQESSKK